MRINTNIASMNAQEAASRTNSSLQGSLEKLSSGLRINKASDDASGLFQLKDFCTNNVTRAEKARDNIYGLNFESHEIVPAIELRQANMVFPTCLLIKEGGLVIEKEILETIK